MSADTCRMPSLPLGAHLCGTSIRRGLLHARRELSEIVVFTVTLCNSKLEDPARNAACRVCSAAVTHLSGTAPSAERDENTGQL
jgi:hypothetical protein